MSGKYRNNTFLKLIYIISMTLAFTTRLGDV